MKELISVTTKKGDKGESFLISGKKISKSNIVFEVLGTLDELNSHLGLVVVKMKNLKTVDQLPTNSMELKSIKKIPSKTTKPESVKEIVSSAIFLLEVQDTLFYLGAQLAESSKESLKISQLKKLEKEADDLQRKMADNWIVKFVLPGGTELGAHIDIARTVSRRLERLIVALSEENLTTKNPVPEIILQYVNRLSDYLFILRCFVNDRLSFEEKLFESKK
ncbi:ATP:cob(I)alamin adenosyltransferase [Candidatus Woesebacteria bacterium]|nr:ATP:cob(I)alamin adenosyltransferase [Candidatus Woesebacteria bacterium]